MTKDRSARLDFEGRTIDLPYVEPTLGFPGVDITNLRDEAGLLALDYGFANTAGTRSGVSFVDGGAGKLLYRGYPIEQLAEKATFLEVAYLLFHGELPSADELESYRHSVTVHTLLNEEMKPLFDAFPRRAHPMAILSSATNAMSTFYPEFQDPTDPHAVEQAALRLIAKIPTIAAFAYKKSIGQQYRYPRNDLGYAANFLHMMFSLPVEEYEVDPVMAKALDLLLILHADHGQNCSTSTVRLVGSSRANLFTSVAAGMSALWGPLHGGANQAVVEMLERIADDGGDYNKYVAKAKDPNDPFRLWGFGHRVYKNYDPRARILKEVASDILERGSVDDSLLEIAKGLEQVALEDDYFVERRLYPNVDFYSGLMFRALGLPTHMFTVLFAMGRLPGWIAQWREMSQDPESRIGRPRQIYNGPQARDYPDKK
ncbi:MAG TPA: citrate synthase [Acidimicrobiia bacterium]|nr:citrate synthase [Acidimicrobiia bacterium]